MAHGFRSSSSEAIQAAATRPMVAQAARCLTQVEKGLNCTGGYRRPRRITKGVANIHGSQETSSVTNNWGQAWCIPSERMTTTFCVASKSPTPNQIDAIHNHGGDFERMGLTSIWLTSILRMIFYGSVGEVNNAGNRLLRAADGLALPGAGRDTKPS